MASRGKAAQLEGWLAEHRPDRIGEEEFEQIRAALAPVSTDHLRRLLRSCGLPLHALIEGVVQSDFAELARTLLALQDEYEAAEPVRRQRVRDVVIKAKEHCRFAMQRARGDAERADEKREALLWINIWLENPPVFRQWLHVRRRT